MDCRKFFKNSFVSTFFIALSSCFQNTGFRYVQQHQCNMMSYIKLKNWPKEIRNFSQFILKLRLARYKLCLKLIYILFVFFRNVDFLEFKTFFVSLDPSYLIINSKLPRDVSNYTKIPNRILIRMS